jgi:hypothetical protein
MAKYVDEMAVDLAGDMVEMKEIIIICIIFLGAQREMEW